MHHNFLTHSFADGHLGGFHILAIVNSAAVNRGTCVCFNSDFLGVYAQHTLLGHMAVLFKILKESTQCSS